MEFLHFPISLNVCFLILKRLWKNCNTCIIHNIRLLQVWFFVINSNWPLSARMVKQCNDKFAKAVTEKKSFWTKWRIQKIQLVTEDWMFRYAQHDEILVINSNCSLSARMVKQCNDKFTMSVKHRERTLKVHVLPELADMEELISLFFL